MKSVHSYHILLLLIVAGISACTSVKPITAEVPPSGNPEYSLIFMIHGDANYVFHEEGNQKYADQEALQNAFDIALEATKGEVFIFHQEPENRILGLLPKKDRFYYHYQNGILVDHGKYSPTDAGFDQEAAIYQAKAQTNKNQYFFYFGHEIPVTDSAVYHASLSGPSFNAREFSNDLSKFGESIKLTVLSSCNNGNPAMIRQLADKTEAVVASPTELHLSYLDVDSVLKLEADPNQSPLTIAEQIAATSFDRLSTTMYTPVSISVYDLTLVSEYVDELYEPYQQYLEQSKTEGFIAAESFDCSTIPGYPKELSSKGVKVFYRPAKFGKTARDKSHSGWGCK
ncbi:MAG: hypothetical protein JJ895_08815 [Balneolaceae bacterium]|nr:hypothetical protein [Balneolaceae bacterium]